MSAVVEHASDAIITKSLDGVILTWNRGAELLYGYEADEVVGRPIAMLAPPSRHDEVPEILERIAAGETVLAPAAAAHLVTGARATTAEAAPRVTDRELQVLRGVARGHTNRQVARELGIGEATVKTHLVHVFTTLGVTNRTAAVGRARELGLLD